MEVCWLADAYSKEVSHLEMYDQQVRYFQETKKYIRPIVTRTYDSSWDMFDRHLYPGGSWRLHMLKNLIGEDVFWEGVHQYVEKYFKKTVETDDFRKSLEEASGMNLTKFFDQWFYGKGYPQLEAKFNFNPKKKTCMIDFKQKQEDKKNGINIFNFDLDVELTLEDGTITTKTITFEEANTSVSFDSNSVPKCVRIDPGLKILFSLDFNPGEDILFNTLKSSKDIFNKIRSGLELIKIGSYSAIQKVSSALKEEKFYGVRSVLASALGEHKVHPFKF
jgi:aminopeptidase N